MSTNPAKIPVLFLGSGVGNGQRLNSSEEVEVLRRELETRVPGRFELVARWGIPATDLLDVIEQHAPLILHFSGHGQPSGELVFSGEGDVAHMPTPEAVAKVFEHFEGRIRCVVLNACHAAVQAEQLAAHVDVVVAIDDEDALVLLACPGVDPAQVIRSELLSNRRFRKRFRREMEVTTRLRHPCTVRVFEPVLTSSPRSVATSSLSVAAPLTR